MAVARLLAVATLGSTPAKGAEKPARLGVYYLGQFDEGLVASLRARPARGYRFEDWTGACNGRKPTCTS